MNSYSLKPAEPEIEQLVERIAKMAGIYYKIEVYATDIPSSVATYYLTGKNRIKKPVIFYNPVILEHIGNINKLAVFGAIAREIIYFQNNDLLNIYYARLAGNRYHTPDSHTKMNPDKFIGWLLWHEGVQLNDALRLYEFPKFRISDIVVHKDQRMMMMKAGWIQAHKRLLLPARLHSTKTETEVEEQLPVVINKGSETNGMLLGLFAFAFIAGGMSMLSGDK